MTVENIDSKLVVLFDACGDSDACVNEQLMGRLGLSYMCERGEFIPLSELELSLMFVGRGFSLADSAFCRFPRMYLSGTQKVYGISDDDYITDSCDEQRQLSYRNNKDIAEQVYAEIANAFGAPLSFEDGPSAYFIDVYIPMEVLSFLKSPEAFREYFQTRAYLTCQHAAACKKNNLAGLV